MRVSGILGHLSRCHVEQMCEIGSPSSGVGLLVLRDYYKRKEKNRRGGKNTIRN